ncbi:MAG: T6SS immunity protein Tli4 family protein [Gammaproteobacteria bacterium]
MKLRASSQSIYGVKVRTESATAQGARDMWEQRLKTIRTMEPPSDASDVVTKLFELRANMPAVWYRDSSTFENSRTIEAMKLESDHVLLLSLDTDAGKESVGEFLLNGVADAYRPGLAQGFCVGHGAIVSEPGKREEAGAALTHRSLPDFEIWLSTDTVGEPFTDHMLADVAGYKAELESKGGMMEVVRDGERSLGGLIGREGGLVIEQPGKESTVVLSWQFPGVGGRANRPAISIRASARLTDKIELETRWDELLESLRTISFP